MPTQRAIAKWISHINKYRLPVLKAAMANVELKGSGLELGAGTCWLSSNLSKDPEIFSITALDIDSERLGYAKKFFIPAFGGKFPKIDIIEGDFHSLPFVANYFDFIVCDAGLHHSEDLERLLREIRRVLKPEGLLLAIREPILPLFSPLRLLRRMTFGWRQRLRGDIERIYTREQWDQYYAKAGFRAEYFEYHLNTTPMERFVALLHKWNGWLFNRYYIVSRPSL